MTDKASEETRITGLIEALEMRHPGREGSGWLPWSTNDHPLAVEHWGLVQQRLNLRYERKVTPAQREAARERMQAARDRNPQPSVLAC